MLFADTTRTGRPFSKDPHVIPFHGKYLMYYSVPPKGNSGWGIGIAESTDLTQWKPIGSLSPAADYEAKGLCAPGALVRNDTIHLFYQTYGNDKKDAICHAWSVDGVNFTRNATNPILPLKRVTGIVDGPLMRKSYLQKESIFFIMLPVHPTM